MGDTKRSVGIFLCKCGTNIAGAIDMDALRKWAEERGEVAWVATHELLCAPAGKDFIKETVDKQSCDSILIAACSPKMHEKTFREVAGEKGFNPAHVNMVNIREQAAWVTPETIEAGNKARALLRAGLERAQKHMDLTMPTMECRTEAVIVGGGIAGIEAAIMLADAGRQVTIIEKDISLGGKVIQTEEVAPAMECAPCLLAPRLSKIRDHKNITVVTNAEVTDILGFLGNFTVKVKRKARYITSACIGCEACFEVCPVSVSSSFHLGMGEHKAVYTAFPGSVPAAAAIDREHCRHFTEGSCSACVEACPFGAVDFDDSEEMLEFGAGAVILATGGGDPEVSRLYGGLGRESNVFTMPQFERLAASNGPTGGEIICADGSVPKSLAVIHCAGSLRSDGLSYCSGICCMNALKAGELMRKKAGDCMVVNIHGRLALSGPQQQHFYERQLHEGTIMVYTEDPTKTTIAKVNGKLKVCPDGGSPVEVDMVVLSTGTEASSSAAAMVQIAAVDLDDTGFFKPGHALLQATSTTIDGIYAAGSCTSPCDVATAVTRGQSAAGDILSKLVAGRKLELEMMTSYIDEELCAGCKMCIAVCPYKAIAFDKEKSVSVVNEAICRGCGTCAATCPGGAAQARHFTNDQLSAELKGVLNG
ncbi:MAG: CoB--CoM heterodisulfide reductase iron-sulfur subunit A family protein [Chitinispirillaceae bacterium]|nr:CoB--CoM heterodisulfide reductase iron-sulfur subunit A family protein [Chitinispirillaceae bacterium]